MSDDTNNEITEEQRTDLVAYLDGELNESGAAEMRLLLAENSSAREEAEELTRAWEALGELDVVRASGEFTEKTLVSIEAIAAETEPDHAALRETTTQRTFDVRRGTALAGWVVGIGLSAFLGFIATNWRMPDKTEQVVKELPLLEKFSEYEDVDIELLRELRKRGVLDEPR